MYNFPISLFNNTAGKMCVITFSDSIYRFIIKPIHTLGHATKIINSTTVDNISGGLFSSFLCLLGSVNPDFIMFLHRVQSIANKIIQCSLRVYFASYIEIR